MLVAAALLKKASIEKSQNTTLDATVRHVSYKMTDSMVGQSAGAANCDAALARVRKTLH